MKKKKTKTGSAATDTERIKNEIYEVLDAATWHEEVQFDIVVAVMLDYAANLKGDFLMSAEQKAARYFIDMVCPSDQR